MDVNLKQQQERFRFYVLTEFKRDVPVGAIHHSLMTAWPDAAPGYSTICRWIAMWKKEDPISLADKSRCGRPISICTDENIDAVRELITTDHHLSIRDLQVLTDLTVFSIHTILTRYLQFRNVSSVWVPKALTQDQRQHRVQCATNLSTHLNNMREQRFSHYVVEDESIVYFDPTFTRSDARVWLPQTQKRPQIPAIKMTPRKCLLVIAFSANKRMNILTLPSGTYLDSARYIEFIRDCGTKWRNLKNNSINLRDVSWQHDNARCHVSRETSSFFESRGIEIVKQSPYSPDLNLCDRWLFHKLKTELRKTIFNSPVEVRNEALRVLKLIPQEDYREQVDKLLRHCERVIEEHGDYVTD